MTSMKYSKSTGMKKNSPNSWVTLSAITPLYRTQRQALKRPLVNRISLKLVSFFSWQSFLKFSCNTGLVLSSLILYSSYSASFQRLSIFCFSISLPNKRVALRMIVDLFVYEIVFVPRLNCSSVGRLPDIIVFCLKDIAPGTLIIPSFMLLPAGPGDPCAGASTVTGKIGET